jgi:hypothetical protein
MHSYVFEFIEHFELIFSIHHVDVNVYYKKALEYCLSKTILGHYRAQQGKLAEGQVETWTLAKEWLATYVDTPANLIATLQEMFNVKYVQHESSSSYYHRFLEAKNKVRNERFTFHQYATIHMMMQTPMECQRKFQEAMTEGKRSQEDMTNLCMRLDFNTIPVIKRPAGETGISNKKMRRDGPPGVKTCTNQYYDNEQRKYIVCGLPLVPHHNDNCPIKSKKAEMKAKYPASSSNQTPVHDRSPHKHWPKKNGNAESKPVARAAKKQQDKGKGKQQYGPSQHGWPAPTPRGKDLVRAGSDLAKSKHAPHNMLLQQIADELNSEALLSADDEYDQLCKFNRTASKKKQMLTHPSSTNQ